MWRTTCGGGGESGKESVLFFTPYNWSSLNFTMKCINYVSKKVKKEKKKM